jgi:hypothetical protein
MGLVLLILVLAMVLGGLPPVSGHWHNLGYAPSGLGLILLVVLLVVLLSGRW